MIKILKYTEYLYLVVAVLASYKVITLWGQQDENMPLFIGFSVVSIGMFFFRRNYRLKFEKRQKENRE